MYARTARSISVMTMRKRQPTNRLSSMKAMMMAMMARA